MGASAVMVEDSSMCRYDAGTNSEQISPTTQKLTIAQTLVRDGARPAGQADV